MASTTDTIFVNATAAGTSIFPQPRAGTDYTIGPAGSVRLLPSCVVDISRDATFRIDDKPFDLPAMVAAFQAAEARAAAAEARLAALEAKVGMLWYAPGMPGAADVEATFTALSEGAAAAPAGGGERDLREAVRASWFRNDPGMGYFVFEPPAPAPLPVPMPPRAGSCVYDNATLY